jgi:aryl-alcohol dehydrogenase-like predicted oxidoreductase
VIARLEENARAVDVTNTLTDEEMREIDALFPAGAAAGTRYAEAGMKTLNR